MKQINTWLWFGIMGTALLGSQFAASYGKATWGDSSIWWTPPSMALPLDKTRQEFELYVKDALLQHHLERESVLVVEKDGTSRPIRPEDVRVRLNNWNRVRASLLHQAVFSGIVLGMSIMCLVVGVISLFGNRASARSKVDAPDGR